MEYLNSDGTPMSLQQKIELQRNRRNKYLALYVDSINVIRWNSMSSEQQQSLIEYRQKLLDVPQQQGFPDNIDWPTPPI